MQGLILSLSLNLSLTPPPTLTLTQATTINREGKDAVTGVTFNFELARGVSISSTGGYELFESFDLLDDGGDNDEMMVCADTHYSSLVQESGIEGNLSKTIFLTLILTLFLTVFLTLTLTLTPKVSSCIEELPVPIKVSPIPFLSPDMSLVKKHFLTPMVTILRFLLSLGVIH